MVIAALAVLSGLLWLLISDRTSPLSSAPTDQTLLEIIRLAFYAMAGIGGVIALTVAYRRQRLSEGEVTREDAKLFNERFAAAADQLASERAANRLAGVYAMASLADEWTSGRQTCVNVLCAYMRMPYEVPPTRAEREAIGIEEFRPVLEERLVRKTVLSVITERLRAKQVPGRSWHECDFDFTGATIDEGDFNDTLFLGAVSFEYTRYPRGSINFVGAVFKGPVSFRRSHFSGARVLFDFTNFQREAHFSQITVSGGILSFCETDFHDQLISFSSSEFSGGEFLFEACEVPDKARIRFDHGTFSGANVRFSSLTRKRIWLTFESPVTWTHPPTLDETCNMFAWLPESESSHAHATSVE